MLQPPVDRLAKGEAAELADRLGELFGIDAFTMRVLDEAGTCEFCGAAQRKAQAQLAGEGGAAFAPHLLEGLVAEWPSRASLDRVFGRAGAPPASGERFTVDRLGVMGSSGRVAQVVELEAPRL